MTKLGSPKLPFCLSSQTEHSVYLNEASDEYESLCAPAKVYGASVLHGVMLAADVCVCVLTFHIFTSTTTGAFLVFCP